ncbi:Polygalacturonase [Arachidicoccus rhizosphaerae]|jgi:polygalacturonase|uniref:Polygalacturonase n=1 Tax=Arachidicoccus rhizosphaerae TaxID=551991 RepID=A0A1H4AR56_9BACT|nr:glycoside hydrolase family 28 protein [Arachidicoccus rhizosphaerae]SEA38400.1 Polygalacturonase [Arachidicoccus rhizosphaerae]
MQKRNFSGSLKFNHKKQYKSPGFMVGGLKTISRCGVAGLLALSTLGAVTGLVSCQSVKNNKSAASSGWDKLDSIKERIVAPTFAQTDFSILDFGAKNDSSFDALPALTRAIDAASQHPGGGRVVVPAGVFFVKGPVHLKSHVELHLEKGSRLKFSTDANDFLPVVHTRYEGIEMMNYSPLIYAYHQTDIAVTGAGVLDGQANNEHWWWWTGSKRFGWKEGMPQQEKPEDKPRLNQMNKDQVPVEQRVFGKGHYLRPTFVEFYGCKNILIQGVTLINSPFWILHPTLSQNITIDGVSTLSYGPNNDGCDPESCRDVWIKNCHFANGDDCIAIKSGRDQDGRAFNVPSKNIIIENCKMEDGHGGVVIGSEASGGAEDIYGQNLEMNSPSLDRAIRIKSNSCRGGVMRRFYFRNIEVGQVHEAVIKINMFYDEKNTAGCTYTPTLDSVFIDHVNSHKSEYAINLQGRDDKHVTHISIDSCSFENVEKESIIKNVDQIEITSTTVNGKPVNAAQIIADSKNAAKK